MCHFVVDQPSTGVPDSLSFSFVKLLLSDRHTTTAPYPVGSAASWSGVEYHSHLSFSVGGWPTGRFLGSPSPIGSWVLRIPSVLGFADSRWFLGFQFPPADENSQGTDAQSISMSDQPTCLRFCALFEPFDSIVGIFTPFISSVNLACLR